MPTNASISMPMSWVRGGQQRSVLADTAGGHAMYFQGNAASKNGSANAHDGITNRGAAHTINSQLWY